MSTVGAVSTARSTILVVISSNLPIPGRFAVALRDRFSYHSETAVSNGGTFDFGMVSDGSAPRYEITIRNIVAGSETLTLTGDPSATTTGAVSPSDEIFKITSLPTSYSLSFGQLTRFFFIVDGIEPTVFPGVEYTGSITIPNSDGDESPFVVNLLVEFDDLGGGPP